MALSETVEPCKDEEFIPGWLSTEDTYLFADGIKNEGYKPDIELYCYPHSTNCMKVMMCLHEKSVPYTKVMVNLNLGHQFHEDFLKLNPKAEVPVLRNRRTGEVLVDSDQIIKRLDKLHRSGNTEYRSLSISDFDEIRMIDECFLRIFREARLETLMYGAVMFDANSLGIHPNYPFNYEPVRQQLKDMMTGRVELLKFEATRLEGTNKMGAEYLQEKAKAFEREMPFMTIREKYEEVIAEFESLLGFVESHLSRYGAGHNYWILDVFMTHVDISFGILLYRLWQIGFGDRLWNVKSRTHVSYFFAKLKRSEGFKMVTHFNETKVEHWPFVVGTVFCLATLTYEFFFKTK